MLQMRNTAQQFINMRNEAQAQQNQLNEYSAARQLLSDPSQFTDENGNLNMDKLGPAVMKVAPTVGPRMIQGISEASTAAAGAKQAISNLSEDSRGKVGKFLMSQVGRKPEEIIGNLDALTKINPQLGPATEFFKRYVITPHSGNQDQLNKSLLNAGQSIMPPTEQRAAMTPGGEVIDNGQQTNVINTNPMAGNVGDTVISSQKQLPPTTQIIGPGNQPGYLGPTSDQQAIVQAESGGNANAISSKGAVGAWQVMPNTKSNPGFGVAPAKNNSPAELDRVGKEYYSAMVNRYGDKTLGAIAYNMGPGATDEWLKKGADYNSLPKETRDYVGKVSTLTALNGRQQAQKSGFVPSGLPAGAAESRAGSIASVNDHWSGLNKQSESAPLIEGLIGNIQALAPAAITGTESGKKQYVVGMMNSLGIGNQATGDLQKDTDLLMKNMAQLNLATPAATDAMRTLVEAGRPHSMMSKDAIIEAAAQLKGQVQATRAMRNALTMPKAMADQTGDMSTYNQMRQSLEQNADPRIWQYEALKPGSPEARKWLSKLTPSDRQSLQDKMTRMVQMGILK